MKHFRKSIVTIVTALSFCFILMFGIQAKAIAPAPNTAISLSYISDNKKNVSFDVALGSLGTKAEVALCDASGNILQSTTCYSYASFKGTKKNKLYSYKFRALTSDVPSTDWSAPKYFTTTKYVVDLAQKKTLTNKVKFVCPKVPGVKNYTLYVSTKSATKGFKKITNIKPGKKYETAKFKNSAIKFYKDYYYKIVPNTTSGVKVDPYINGFYLYKTYR